MRDAGVCNCPSICTTGGSHTAIGHRVGGPPAKPPACLTFSDVPPVVRASACCSRVYTNGLKPALQTAGGIEVSIILAGCRYLLPAPPMAIRCDLVRRYITPSATAGVLWLGSPSSIRPRGWK